MNHSVDIEDVARKAAELDGGGPAPVIELFPHGTVRTFRVGGVGLRVDEDPQGRALQAEALALSAMAAAGEPALGPALLAHGRLVGRDGERAYLCYSWIHGRTLESADAPARARDAGECFARLHSLRVMDLFGRLPEGLAPTTLLEGFRRAVDDLRVWMAAREADGLAQDLLTMALSDLQRALRPYCIALDHAFLVSRRRVLCHGAPRPSFLVLREEARAPLAFVNLERATCGDGAQDLAGYAIAAGLDDAAEEAMLRAYLDALDREGRADRRLLPRYFAQKTLGLFAQPCARLARLARIKRGEVAVLGDPVVVIEDEATKAYEEIARAMNGLRDLGGRARPVRASEVMALGRLLAVEELLLRDRAFRIALLGQPYSGKTEIASLLARRLTRHRLLGTGALGRALARVEQELIAQGQAAPRPRELVQALFERGFAMEPRADPPFYVARLNGNDVTDELRDDGPLHVRGAQLLDDEVVRAALRDALLERSASEGLVLEGDYAAQLLPGRGQVFFVKADRGVRAARLLSHKEDLGEEAAAAEHLHQLDLGQPPPPVDAVAVEVGARTAAAATLEVLWQLLPPGRRPHDDLTGRAPL